MVFFHNDLAIVRNLFTIFKQGIDTEFFQQ
jgi:hypothetical protein